MNVKKLRELLKLYPPDMIVVADSSNNIVYDIDYLRMVHILSNDAPDYGPHTIVDGAVYDESAIQICKSKACLEDQ
jgi:hypothetical protein